MSKKKQAGKLIRIGPELELILDRKKAKHESYNAILKRHFDIPRNPAPHGVPRLVFSCWMFLDNGEPKPFLTKAEAEGYAIQVQVREKKKKADRVIRVQEVI